MTASLFLLASPQRATVQMHMNEQWPSLRQDVFHTLGLLLSGFLAEYQLFQIRAMSTMPRQDVADGRAKSAQFWFTRRPELSK